MCITFVHLSFWEMKWIQKWFQDFIRMLSEIQWNESKDLRTLGGASLYSLSMAWEFLFWGSHLKEAWALLTGFVLHCKLALISIAKGCEVSYTPIFVFEGVWLNTKHMWFVFRWTRSNNHQHKCYVMNLK